MVPDWYTPDRRSSGIGVLQPRVAALAKTQQEDQGSVLLYVTAASEIRNAAIAEKTEQDRLGLYGQANKRIWWMPWRQQAMKDVVACDKPRGAGKQALIRGFPNGATHPS